MAMSKKEKEIYEEYMSSLVDLNVNSKPLINMLTILAEENIEFGQVIVNAVEQHISKVETDVKLPVLYLIDSIVKNVGREYITLFSLSIVNIFCGVFEKVNEKIREKMFALRQTWNDVFPMQKLYTLDVKIHSLDQGWPITAKVVPRTPAIHVNPNFLKNNNPAENDMQAQLLDKQRQLLELQKRKLELELEATKKHIEEQEKQLHLQAANVANNSVVPKPETNMNLPNQMPGPSPGFGLQRPHLPQQRIRVAPVNPALISSVRLRDPRLMRQMQQQQQQQHQEQLQQQQPLAHHMGAGNHHNRGMLFRNRNQSTNRFPMTPNAPNSDSFVHRDNDTRNPRNNKTIVDNKSRTNSALSIHGGSGRGRLNKSPIKPKSSLTDRKHSSRSSERSNSTSINISKQSSNNSSIEKDRKKSISDKSGSLPSSPTDRKKNKRSNSPSSLRSSSIDKSPHKTLDTKSSTKSSRSPSHRDSKARSKDPKVTATTKRPRQADGEDDIKPVSPKQSPQDVDLRVKPETIADVVLPPLVDQTVEQALQPVHPIMVTPAIVNDIKVNDQIESSSKDVDLRRLITNVVSPIAVPNLVPVAEIPSSVNRSVKRESEERTDEPVLKKSKAEKIDILFGKEDVDLRQINQSIIPLKKEPSPPPPPVISSVKEETNENWALIKGASPKNNKSNLEAVRAKLAEATRLKDKTIRPKDIDLRPIQRNLDALEENSEQGIDAKIKIMMAQAQEQFDSDLMNAEQYNVLLRQMIQMKETQSQKQREPLKRKNMDHVMKDEATFSSGSDSESLRQSHVVPKRDRQEKDRYMGSDNNRDNKSRRHKERKTKWSVPWDNNKQSNAPQNISSQNITPAPPPPSQPIMIGPHAPPFMFPQSQSNINQTGPTQPPHHHIPSLLDLQPMPWPDPQIPPPQPPQLPQPPQPPQLPQPAQQFNAPPLKNLVMATCAATVKSTKRTINIDGIPREIRFYDEVAIAFMDLDAREPKEIGFQMGERAVTVDGRDRITLSFNDTYKPFMVDGQTYQIRLGAPTRELYIDNNWYECYFGEPPVGITLNERVRVFEVEGPAPQVRIGSQRSDLVVGKVDMYVNASFKFSLFLDAQVQTFQVGDKIHTVQFADYLLTALIDNEPFIIEYGGMPKTFRCHDTDYFIRFSVLPNHVVPGNVYIRNMIRTQNHRNISSPPAVVIADVVPPPVIVPSHPVFNSVVNPVSIPSSSVVPNVTPAALPSVDIDILFKKLVATGILINNQKTDDKEKHKEKPKPVSLAQPETLKIRQPALVHALYSGMQCSSCGVRFPPEQSIKYSQHLDWHFRQNRRERDLARRPHYRKWYYDVSDWTQYEEIEDTDDREKNWFENQQLEMLPTNDESNNRTGTPPPTCVAGPDDVDRSCEMCHDPFDTFYNEETEEWNLRPALRMDGKLYHPTCYDDHKASLTLDESALNAVENDDNAVELLIKNEEENIIENVILDEDDDDDVIVLPQEEPVITEIPDDDDLLPEATTDAEVLPTDVPEIVDDAIMDDSVGNNESDVQILEQQITVMDLDDFVEKPVDESVQITAFKIKVEPRDGYESNEDDAFEDIGTFESSFLNDDGSQPVQQVTCTTAATLAETTSTITVPTIDGNIELKDAPPPTTSTTNKIKINITNIVTKNVNNENTENNDNGEAATVTAIATDKEENVEDIQFELKDALKGVHLTRRPNVKCGSETSGLCSIM